MRPPRTVAYLRLTTVGPAPAQAKAAMVQCAQARGLANLEWLEEGMSDQIPRPAGQIAQVLAELQPGDHVLVSHLGQLGRSLVECLEILLRAVSRGICIDAVEGGWQIDQAFPAQALAQWLALVVAVEKASVSQRTKQALAARKKAGLTLGRPRGSGQSKLDLYRAEIETLLVNGASRKFIADRYGTTEANLGQWLKKHTLKRW
jgi:DNA invertase Pin-like site-specific DNA recombinase